MSTCTIFHFVSFTRFLFSFIPGWPRTTSAHDTFFRCTLAHDAEILWPGLVAGFDFSPPWLPSLSLLGMLNRFRSRRLCVWRRLLFDVRVRRFRPLPVPLPLTWFPTNSMSLSYNDYISSSSFLTIPISCDERVYQLLKQRNYGL